MSKGVVYKQGLIVAELERRLEAGDYTANFPVGAELAAEFGVNIKTINKAIKQLVEAGRLTRKRGVGTFVQSQRAGEHQIEVLFEGYSALFEHPFWGEIWNGCISQLLDAGYRPVLTQLRANEETGEILLDNFRFTCSEGKILLGITHPAFLKLIQQQNVPVVSAGDRIADPDFPQVCFDYQPGIQEAMRFLADRGYQKIAFLGQVKEGYNPMLLDKFHAFRQALESLGLYDPKFLEHTSPLPEAAGNSLMRLLERTIPDAIFVACDHQVPTIEKILKARRMRLPVIGCDGLAFATWPTVALPRRAAGEAAAKMLIARLKGAPSSTQTVLPSVFNY